MMLRSVACATSAAAVRRARVVAGGLPRGLSTTMPMVEEYEGVPNTTPTAPSPPKTTASTLSNGAKVVTLENGQLASAVGLVVSSGSRDESSLQAGASLLLQGMAYKRTADRTPLKLQRDVEVAGGTLYASGGRETMTYMADCPASAAETVLNSIAASVLSPRILGWEISDAKEKLEEVSLRIHSESTSSRVMEALHAAAYGDATTLGKPYSYGPCTLSADGLKEFRAARYKASGMTVLGVNVPHEDLKSIAESVLAQADTSAIPQRPASKYLAGEVRIRASTPETSVSLAYSAPPASDKRSPAYEVLATLLDSRAKALTLAGTGFVTMYSDGGLVGVTGTAKSADAAALSQSLAACLKDLARGPSASELEAALKAAKVARHLNMENPTDALIAMARSAKEACDLDGVTMEAVKSAAAEAAKSGLTVASVGNIGDVLLKAQIEASL